MNYKGELYYIINELLKRRLIKRDINNKIGVYHEKK